MDLLTHAALGAAGAAAIARPQMARVAALTGALAGLLPDADQLIADANDPLLTLEYHRHFTHALIIVPVGALLAALLMHALTRRKLPFLHLYAYALIGCVLAPLLDACTSYGTHLLWPFTERRIAWNIISIIDPIFTLSVLAGLAVTLIRKRPAYARVGVGLAAIVLFAGFVQHQRAFAHVRELAASRGHAAEQSLVKPTLANLLLWRTLYIADGRIYVDAVRLGIGSNVRTYAGESAARFDVDRDLDLPQGSILRRDVQRFVAFSEGITVRVPGRPEMIGDARYSMLPTRVKPLWGIVLDPASPQAHARFETNRTLTPEIRQQFIDMLLGRDLEPPT